MSDLLAEWVLPVESWKVRDFARAVQDPCPEQPAPTFPVVLNAAFIERLMRELLPVDRSRTVHGEQEYEYRRPLRVGETVRCRARLLSDTTKAGRRGGAMRFLVTEIEMSNAESGEIIGWERSTAIETQPLAEGTAP